MDLRILDLDGCYRQQIELLRRFRPVIHDLRRWGPQMRLACSFGRFRQFEEALAGALKSTRERTPALSLIGSGDFHHVTLALLRRIQQPFNLLILDNHPDWVTRVPLLHCGTWVEHALRLPTVKTIFHVGGDVDFDNHYRWFAPWRELRSGRIQVLPAIRRFRRGPWKSIAHTPLRTGSEWPATVECISQLLDPFRDRLARWPLYISVDKDVLTTENSLVNWDSGHLVLSELLAVLNVFAGAAQQRLAGMDLIGDWSRVRLQGIGRRLLHLTEHPRLNFTPIEAALCNERTNVQLLDWALNTARVLPEKLGELQDKLSEPQASAQHCEPQASARGES